MIKRLLLPVLLLMSLSGCTAKEYDWVVKIENQPVDPHTYVAAQLQAYAEARPLAEDSTDLLHSTIDGEDSGHWINIHTIDKLKRNYFVNTEFEKRNLKFASQAEDFIKMFAEEGWDNVKHIYTNNGLEIDHYVYYLESLYKEQLLFNDIFINSSENPVTDREVEEYLGENLCRVSLFKVARINDDGTPVNDDQISQLEIIVNDAVKRINDGTAIADAASAALTRAGPVLGSDADFSNGADFVSTAYISSSNVNLVYDFMADFFTLPVGSCVYYTLDDCYYICHKIPLSDTQVEYMYLKQDVINFIRDEEFEKMIADACAGYAVEYNSQAVDAYSTAKINMNIG